MAKKQFKSESKRLLDLMINSIYTHKEIFLRELISNASDAIDKMCFIALTDDKLGLSRSDFKIEIASDKQARTLTVRDNGIGMDKEDLENNLGTIAASGSYNFKQQNAKTEDIDIIGQFGVGFYSAFMVAKKIVVKTKKYKAESGYIWQSEGADGYTIAECELETPRTEIILYIKDDTDDEKYGEFLESFKIADLVKKYSDYIRFPIIMDVETRKIKPGTEDEDTPEFETATETRTLNSMVPLWQKNKKDVTKEEYDDFYKEKFYDFEPPLHTIQTAVEGVVTYKALLFVPQKPPYDYYTKEYKPGLQLYSSGVMIMESCADLLPEHFRFVRGIVDSPDLSLNISRELLQHDRQLKIISQNLAKKIKTELQNLLKNNREEYEKFFEGFGRIIKYGAVNNFGLDKDQVKDLFLFYSSSEKKNVTLAEYTERMKESQKYIYYALGESVNTIDKLPQTELLKDNGYEILYLTDEIDEFTLQSLRSYNEKDFRSILNEDPEIEQTNEPTEEKQEDYSDVVAFVKETLGQKVDDVEISKKLKSHPVCLTAKGGVSFEMEKYMAQVNPTANVKAKRVLEINPSHPAIAATKAAIAANPEKAAKYAELLYSQARIIAGLNLDDPSGYTDLVCELFI
ncbi:MAG: molecular chaperone HtpG [Oscillospiraceae bacterium]|nr:molecular chaperone HtpG [Oscillospiraceae bacterium]